MKHLYSQISRIPCDVHDCATCTAEAHHDFNHVEESYSSPSTADATSIKPNLFPPFSSTERSRKDIKKKLKSKQRGLSDNGSSPRALALQHIAMSTTPRVNNPYEEEFIEELLLPKEIKTGKRNGNKNALFPYIPQSPPSRPRRIRISTGPSSRRTVSAPGVETTNLKTLFSKT